MCDLSVLRKGLRVLVVDNDLDSRQLLETLFDGYGVETVTATSVRESLEIIQEAQPDLLISEIALPNEDGYSLMSKVKAFEKMYQIRIPAIALTAYAQDDDRIHALAAGFCKHLPKPLNIDKLIAAMACLTGQTQAVATGACQ